MNTTNNLLVLSFGIEFSKDYGDWIVLEATKFNEKNNKALSWAIRRPGRTCFSKLTGEFNYEPLPSSRGDEFFKEYRFDSPEEAMKCWEKFKKKKK